MFVFENIKFLFVFKHIYTSLAEIQVQQEEDIAKSPISVKEPTVALTSTETLYQVTYKQQSDHILVIQGTILKPC